MSKTQIVFCKVKGAEDLPLPKYMTAEAAGLDLSANVFDTVTIKPQEFKMIPCGVMLQLPQGYEAQVRPRSGLAAKFGITVLNSPGTIDSDYRGEIRVLLINHGKEDFIIKRGDRIAQLVISKIVQADIFEKSSLDFSNRGQGGFGHTGI